MTLNPMQPQPVDEQAAEETKPQQQPTLEDYAHGLNNINTDLQRQSAAYGHFRTVLAQIDAIAADPNAKVGSLPFISVTYPQNSPKPGEMKLDMNVLPKEVVVAFRPLFEQLAQSAANGLLTAWDNVHEVVSHTEPIVKAAKNAG